MRKIYFYIDIFSRFELSYQSCFWYFNSYLGYRHREIESERDRQKQRKRITRPQCKYNSIKPHPPTINISL